jgi:hypothetical protein
LRSHSPPHSARIYSGELIDDKGSWETALKHPIPESSCKVIWMEVWFYAQSGLDTLNFCLIPEDSKEKEYCFIDPFFGDDQKWIKYQVRLDKSANTLTFFYGDQQQESASVGGNDFVTLSFRVTGNMGESENSPGVLVDDVRIYDDGWP